MPCSVLVALARGQVLTVLPLLSPSAADHNTGSPSNGSGFVSSPLHYSKHHFTALAWFAQLKPHKSVSSARCSHAQPEHLQQKQQQQQPWHGHSSAPMEQQDRRWHDTIELAESLLDSEVLLSGTADGQLQIHTPTGQLLFKQRLSTSPVLDILVRPHCSGQPQDRRVCFGATCFSWSAQHSPSPAVQVVIAASAGYPWRFYIQQLQALTCVSP